MTADNKKVEIDDSFEALLEPFYHGKRLGDPISTLVDKWQLVPAFLKVKGLVKQHLDSYDFFVNHEIKDIVKANYRITSDVDPTLFIEFLDIRVGAPDRGTDEQTRSKITPMECRLRDLTYSAPVVVDIAFLRDKRRVIKRDLVMCHMPVMLRSSKCYLHGANNHAMQMMNECPLDPGGYFIVNGTERVVLIQEQLSKNRIIVEADPLGGIDASVTSHTHERKSKTYVKLRKGRIVMTSNILIDHVPIVIIIKGLAGLSDVEIIQLVAGSDEVYQDLFAVNFDDAAKAGVYTQQQALEYIGAKVRLGSLGRTTSSGAHTRRSNAEQGLDALATMIIAHVPVDGLNFYPKAVYVALMVRRILMAVQDPKLVDDRDFVGNKRLELAGELLSLLFEDLFKKFLFDVKANLDGALKRTNRAGPADPSQFMLTPGKCITTGMCRALQTGNWNVKRFNMSRSGVTHVLSRLSYISAIGMMTRISSQFEKTRKVSGPRALQPSQWGMLCPSDTPEGEGCGLIKNLALTTHITTRNDDVAVRRIVHMVDSSVEAISHISGAELHRFGFFGIYMNGTPIAATGYPKRFAAKFRAARRRGLMSPFISISINQHTRAVHIASDEGRICRPCIIVKRGKSQLKAEHLEALRDRTMAFQDFFTQEIVEYLDVNEENDTLIATTESEIEKNTTHLEIEPFTILGAVAGLIPFPNHNQSPRNTYQCAMGKQAIGAIAYNQFNRIDTLLYTLVYPQRPMVVTKTIELISYDKLPAGQSATVVVMSYSGYDIEDALVLNKASLDRGFARCQVFRKHTSELVKHSASHTDYLVPPQLTQQEILRPDGSTETRISQVPKDAALDLDGLASVGNIIEMDQTMIKKESWINADRDWMSTTPNAKPSTRPTPVNYKVADPAYIDKVILTRSAKDNTLVKVLTRQTRRPEIGDKFSSRHGQKGVVGRIAEHEDLPFSDQGLVPDIIMNPHGFPSRMTVGKLFECLTGKAAVVAGKREYGYGDAFRSHPVASMGKVLVDHGFSWEGKDYFTSGETGEPFEAYIFNGPIFYQRLKHMVQDKMHARSRGPMAILTRQPTEGRAKSGGLRLGEMERDCLIAYGASQLLLERLMLSSDAVRIGICEQCGLFASRGWCHTCQSSRHVCDKIMPYAAKLLIQELISMNVGVRLKLEDEFSSRT